MTYEEILAYLESLKGTPVDLTAQSNPNATTPTAQGGSNVAWGNVPGLEQFYSYDQANNQENFNLQEALPEIQRLGYQVMQANDPGAETSASWVAGPDGRPIAQSAHLTGTNDDAFKLAALAAMGITGAAASGLLGGGVAAGTTTGGTGTVGSLFPELMTAGTAGGVAPLTMAGLEPLAALPALGSMPSMAGFGAAASALPAMSSALPAASGLLSGIDPTLAQLAGAALGAASSQDQEQTTTQKNEPWEPAQQWIKDNIAAGQGLQKKYTDNPFSPGQQTAYQNLYGLLNSFNTEMLPGLLGNANAMSQGYDRYAPKETRARPQFGAVGSTWAPGLLKFGG